MAGKVCSAFTVRGAIAALLCLALLFRILLLNFPGFFSATDKQTVATEINMSLKKSESELSTRIPGTELSPMMIIEDSSELDSDTFVKFSKLPVLFLALLSLLKWTIDFDVCHQNFAIHAKGVRMRRHLSFSVIRV